MNILVVGCGKVGTRLALTLDQEGHDVSVIDSSEEALDLMPDSFRGFKTCGIPIDQDVLKNAGIESCDALAAVSQDDNVNIMVSQLAREIFKVPTVIARIYDPKREDVFSHFGLHTVCPTNLTVAAVKSAITEKSKPQTINLGSHTASFSTIDLPKGLSGATTDTLNMSDKQSLYAVLHADLSITVYHGQKIRFKPDDKLVISSIID